jgi:hypothetical protein
MTQTVSAALEAAGLVAFDGEYAQIPEHMQQVLRRYVLEGVRPGDFLTSVVCNDLRNAVGRADETNLPLLKLYVQWFYNIAPGSCWGSAEAMLKWCESRRAEIAQAYSELPARAGAT